LHVFFRKENHSPYTRRDVVAVLTEVGFNKESLAKEKGPYEAIASVIGGVSDTDPTPNKKGNPRHGYYVFKNSIPDPEPIPLESMYLGDEDIEDIEVQIVRKEGIVWKPEILNEGKPAKGLSEAVRIYEEDEGLRRLAVSNTPCFAIGYSPKAKQCKVCPLSVRCSVNSLGVFAIIGRDLDRATKLSIENTAENERRRRADEARKKAEDKAAKNRAEDAEKNPPPDPGDMSNEEVQRRLNEKYGDTGSSVIQLPFEGVCSFCNIQMDKGEQGVHLPGRGMVHIPCALNAP